MSDGAALPERRTPGVTELLTSWCAGDESALAQLTPLVHDELHRLAHRQMRNERGGHTLQTTAVWQFAKKWLQRELSGRGER